MGEEEDGDSCRCEANKNSGDEVGPEESSDVEVGDEEIRQHRTYEQVMLDVNRCAGRLERIHQVYYHRTDDDLPPEDLTEEFELQKSLDEDSGTIDANEGDGGDDDEASAGAKEEEEEAKKDLSANTASLKEDLTNQRELKKKLAKLIVKLLIKKPDLHYYQGFHDVCLTYMTLLGDQDAYTKLDTLIDSHFNTFMKPTMSETQDFLALIPIIIGLREKKLQEFLEQSEVGVIFALSWVITWFSHVIPNQRDVETIFKFLQDQDPHMVLYLCAEIVVFKRDRILELEPEMSTVHHFLCQVPRKENLPIVDLLEKAKETFKRWSPEMVKQELNEQLKSRLQLQNNGIIAHLAGRLVPTLQGLVLNVPSRTPMVVLVLISAIALQIYRHVRE